MASTGSKSRRTSMLSRPMPRPALEEEDWDTKRMRLIQEHFANSAGNRATSEDDRREDEDWERTQKDQKRHEADPAAAVRRWRDLWEQRTPGGSNKELEELCGSFHYYSDVLDQYSDQGNLEADSTEGGLFRLWKALCDCGLPEVCTILARDESLFNENEEVLNAVLAVSCGIVTWGASLAPGDFDDWSIMPGALALVRAICPNIWDHRDMLLGEGPTYGNQNRLRLDVAQLLFELSLAPDIGEPNEDSPEISGFEESERLRVDASVAKLETRNLAFFCWIEGTPPSDLNRAFFGRDDYNVPTGLSDTLLREVAESLDYDPGGPESAAAVTSSTSFIGNQILDTYGAPKFFTRINASLRESGLGRTLMVLLASLSKFANHPLLQTHIVEHGTYLAIREAVDRELRQGESDYDHYIVLREELCIYRTTFALGSGKECAHLARDCNCIQLISRYVRLYALLGHAEVTWEQGEASERYKPLHYVNTYSSFATLVNMRSDRNPLRKAMRLSLRQEWYPTLHVLRTQQRESALWKSLDDQLKIANLELAWARLGQDALLDEAAERRDFEREAKKSTMFCAWRACQYHVEKPPAPLQTCKGCGQAKYCSRACQKLDWKEGRHKARCGNRLTAG